MRLNNSIHVQHLTSLAVIIVNKELFMYVVHIFTYMTVRKEKRRSFNMTVYLHLKHILISDKDCSVILNIQYQSPM